MASMRPGRRSYALVLKDGSKQEFHAQDAAHALRHVQAIWPEGLAASLCEDGVLLAEISYSPGGYWAVSKPSSTAGRC